VAENVSVLNIMPKWLLTIHLQRHTPKSCIQNRLYIYRILSNPGSFILNLFKCAVSRFSSLWMHAQSKFIIFVRRVLYCPKKKKMPPPPFERKRSRLRLAVTERVPNYRSLALCVYQVLEEEGGDGGGCKGLCTLYGTYEHIVSDKNSVY
jgi:hypothetical protein